MKHKLLSKSEVSRVTRARRVAEKRLVFVKGYTRSFYWLQGQSRKLARWEDLDRALFRLCSQVDRIGLDPSDKAKARLAVQLIRDTFKV